jgi:hypothetical protein
MRMSLKHLVNRHLMIAAALLAVLGYPTHSHGWWLQIRFAFFLPVIWLHKFLPTRFFMQSDSLHYVGIIVTTVLAFLYTWTLVYIVAKAWSYLNRRDVIAISDSAE